MNPWVLGGTVMVLLSINLIVGVVQTRGRVDLTTWRSDPNIRGPIAVALSVTGTIVGGGMFIAVGQIGFEAGVVGYFIGLVYLIGLFVLARFVGVIRGVMEDAEAKTLLELVDHRYSKAVVTAFALVNLAMYVFLLAGQFIGMAVVARFISTWGETTALPWVLVGCAAAIALVYPIIGGLRKDIVTDLIQVSLVVVVGILLGWLLITGDFGRGVISQLPPSHLDGSGYGIVFLIGVLLFLGPLFIVRQDIWQRIRTAKDEKAASHGLVIAGIISAAFYILFTSIGMASAASGHSDPGNATLYWLFEIIQSDELLALAIGAFFFAVLSSSDTMLNNASLFGSFLLFRSRWQQLKNGNTNLKSAEYSLLTRTRAIAVLLGLLAIALGWFSRNFVELLVGAFSLLLIFLPAIVGLLVPRWRNNDAAFWSVLSALTLFLLLFWAWDTTQAFVPAVMLAVAVYIGVALKTKPGNSGKD